MPNFIDITGHQYGDWLVESRADNIDRRVAWNCMCICGTRRAVLGQSLVSGASRGCGCSRPRTRFGTDITGKVFTYLAVIKETDKRDCSGGVLWECVCRCGKTVFVSRSNLHKGHDKSCGCYMREHNANALRQRRFKHGLSNTKEYKAYLQRLRYEQQQNIDSGWNFEYERLLRLAQPVCVVCGRTEDSNIERYGKRLEVDHVYPLSRGYGLEPGNAVILCTFCNDSKGGKLLHQLDDVMSSRIIAAAESFRHICEAK